MKPIKAMMMTALALGLSACATVAPTTRNAPLDLALSATPTAQAVARADVVTPSNETTFKVVAIKVSVPDYLRVSESNLLYPIADIVWHGDPAGDRHAQIRAIFEAGLGRGVQGMNGVQEMNGVQGLNGDRAVVLDVVVKRFHALTKTARYTVGGVHSIKFLLTLRDAKTGEVVMGPRVIKADLKAFGGRRARLAERAGQTQKVRIIDHLAQVIAAELTPPFDGRPVHNLKFQTASLR